MSTRLLVATAHSESQTPDTSNVDKNHLGQFESQMIHDESLAQPEYLNAANYKATLNDTNLGDPVLLAQRNPTNDPEHAYTFVFANRPIMAEPTFGRVGFVKDEDAGLRTVETLGHVPQYLPVDSAPPLPTYSQTPGFVRLPGLF
jgi:hypothetical protein